MPSDDLLFHPGPHSSAVSPGNKAQDYLHKLDLRSSEKSRGCNVMMFGNSDLFFFSLPLACPPSFSLLVSSSSFYQLFKDAAADCHNPLLLLSPSRYFYEDTDPATFPRCLNKRLLTRLEEEERTGTMKVKLGLSRTQIGSLAKPSDLRHTSVTFTITLLPPGGKPC